LHVDSNQTRLVDAYGPAVENVVHLLRREPQAALSLGDMADIAALSSFHFCRVFRSIVGIPPVEFQAALRLDLAKRLLLTTPLSVTEICFEVGYGSPGTFISRFTRQVGVPPRSLRHIAQDGPKTGPSTHRPTLPQVTEFGVRGHVCGPDTISGRIFVALFPGPVPQGRPIACDTLSKPGPYRIASVPDGRWFLLAAALSASSRAEEGVFLPPISLVAVGDGPLTVRRGRVMGHTNLWLRPPRLLDPPVLIALPLPPLSVGKGG
jgi:AraC family transcriptional regulator